MRAEYERLKAGANGAPVFDRWFAAGANNAGIAAVGLYADRVPEFRALLAAEGGDLPRFYARVKALAALPKAERDAALRRLWRGPGPTALQRLDLTGVLPHKLIGSLASPAADGEATSAPRSAMQPSAAAQPTTRSVLHASL